MPVTAVKMVTHTAETVGAEKLLATTKMSTNGVNGHETGPLADNNYGPPANHPAAPQNTPIVGTPVVGVLVAASPPTTIRMTDSEYEYPEREQPANEQSRHGGESLPTVCNLQDCVFIKDLQLTTVVGEDAWNRPGKPQPVLISVRVHRHISSAGANDDVDGTLSYSMVVKDIQEVVKDGEGSGGFRSASDLSHAIFEKSHGRWGAWAVFININLPKGCLRAEGGFHLASIYHEKVADRGEESMVTGIRVPCIIGVNDHERLAKQNVVISFKIVEDKSTQADAGPGTTGHWREMSSQVAQVCLAHYISPILSC